MVTSPNLPDRYIAHVDELTRGFIGREWLVDEVNSWIDTAVPTRFLLLEGPPGIGKSAFVAHLVQQRAFAAVHFCIARQQDTVDPIAFTESLYNQLVAREPGLLAVLEPVAATHVEVRMNIGTAQNVVGARIENLSISMASASAAFSRLIIGPLLRLPADRLSEPVVVLVDGLDEAAQTDTPDSIVQLIARAESLPRCVRFILTSRPRDAIRGQFAPSQLRVIDLEAELADNVNDVERCVRHAFQSDPKLAALLKDGGKPEAVVMRDVARASGHNFLCLYWLLRALREATQRLDQLDEAPHWLAEVYYQFLRARGWLANPQAWRKRYRPAIGVLTAARSALSATEIGLLCDLSQQDVADILTDIAEFLDPAEARCGLHRLYHTTLVDFFERKVSAREFWIDTAAVNHAIGRAYAARFSGRWSEATQYALDFLPYHLFHAQAHDELARLLCDLGFLQATMAKRGVGTVLEHHRYVREFPAAQPIRTSIRTQRHRLAKRPGAFLQQVLSYLLDLSSDLPDYIRLSSEQAAATSGDSPLWFKRVNGLRARNDEAFDMVVAESAEHVALSGAHVAVAVATGAVVFYDTESGLPAQRFPGADAVRALAISRDGRLMARFGASGKVELFKIDSEYLIAAFDVQIDATCATFLDDNRIAVGAKDGTLGVLDLDSGTWSTLAKMTEPVERVRASGDGQRIAGIAHHRDFNGYSQLLVIDATTGATVFEACDDSIEDATLCDDSKFIAAMSELDINYITLVKLFSADGEQKREYYDSMWLTALAHLPVDGRIAVGGAYGSISLWRPDAGDPWKLDECPTRIDLSGHEGRIEDLVAARDSDLLVSRDRNGVAKVWRTARAARSSQDGHRATLRFGLISPDGSTAVSVDIENGWKLWRVETGEWLQLPAAAPAQVARVFPVTREVVAFSRGYDSVSAIDTGASTTSARKLSLGTYAKALAVSPDGRHALVSRLAEPGVAAIDLVSLTKSAKPVVLDRNAGFHSEALFTSSGGYAIVVLDCANQIVCHDAATGARRWKFVTKSKATAFAASPDERWLAVAGDRGTIEIYSLADPRSARHLFGDGRTIMAMAFVGRSGLLVSVDFDGVVSAWSIAEQTCLGEFYCEAPALDLWGHSERNEILVMDSARVPRLMRFELVRRGGGSQPAAWRKVSD